jgi:hypothetical protein
MVGRVIGAALAICFSFDVALLVPDYHKQGNTILDVSPAAKLPHLLGRWIYASVKETRVPQNP